MSHSTAPMKAPVFSKAYTLVELLVGMLLGLFIIGLSFTYMVSSSSTFKVQTNDSMIQENARFALDLITQNIRMAGSDPTNDFNNQLSVFFDDPICSPNEAGVAPGATGNTPCTTDNLGVSGSDRIAIDFIVTANLTTCNGTVINADGQRYSNAFWTADIDGDGVRSLYCQTYQVVTGAPSIALGNPLPLVDGIDRLQVQYGIDTTGPNVAGTNPPDGVVDRYVSYTNLGLRGFNGTQVRVVRIAMLINSGINATQTAGGLTGQQTQGATVQGANVQNTVIADRNYTLLDAPTEQINQDQVFRQIFSTTILLPNGV